MPDRIAQKFVMVHKRRPLIRSETSCVVCHTRSKRVEQLIRAHEGDRDVRKTILAAALGMSTAFAGSANAANIVETAANAGTFQTLIAAAKAAGLDGALSDGKNLTVFAPTDDAFAKLPKGTVESLLKPENKSKLAAILSYHVLPRQLTSDQLPHKSIHVRTIKSGGDRTLRVTKGSAGVTVDNASVIKADIKASNGVIHVIDTVMLPSR